MQIVSTKFEEGRRDEVVAGRTNSKVYQAPFQADKLSSKVSCVLSFPPLTENELFQKQRL